MTDYKTINAQQSISESDPFTVERYQQFYEYFLPSTKTIVDVGCNTGRGGACLKQLNQKLELIGLDCVDSRLEVLPQGVYSRILCCYSTKIDLPDNATDAIVAGEFVEHLLQEDVEKTLNEFSRLLRQGGIVLLTTPNPGYIRLKLTGRSVVGGAHLSQYYPCELVQLLARAGFRNTLVKGSGKMTRLLGDQFPFLSFYGSYLVRAFK